MDKIFKNKDIPVEISFIYDNQTISGTLLGYSVVGDVVKVELKKNGKIFVYPFKDIKDINFTSGGKRKSRRNRKSKKTKKSTRRNRKSKKTKKSTRRKR